ncbi:FixH family protein [Cyclobacterium plantarum]|uniref:Nitrogen fixation protein FixH n=1 Tax=Cyclobacterium plantarum TaxID=2716263 RepID=A0ABX0H708_9BACT|nr:FixH family protein [Cyclobacterium plantarum]NHE56148.1 nitrogen fixation protein FixH [Cyclobacterium plantarum]
MNWGNGIVLVFVVFVAIMATMVTICMKQDDLHLVTENYYEEEIKYQEHIDKVSNSLESSKEAMSFDAQAKMLDLNLPVGAKGELHLFRPSDARMDKKIDVNIKDTEVNTVDLNSLSPGYWRVKLSWERDGVGFFEEKKIDL